MCNFNNFLFRTQINNLNDTHQQLIVHWVGEGSSIIICLARDSKEASRRAKIPSAVYYSYDYGETFENKTNLFKMPNGTFVQLDKFFIHTKFPERVRNFIHYLIEKKYSRPIFIAFIYS